jgi:hypothetical protein
MDCICLAKLPYLVASAQKQSDISNSIGQIGYCDNHRGTNAPQEAVGIDSTAQLQEKDVEFVIQRAQEDLRS